MTFGAMTAPTVAARMNHGTTSAVSGYWRMLSIEW